MSADTLTDAMIRDLLNLPVNQIQSITVGNCESVDEVELESLVWRFKRIKVNHPSREIKDKEWPVGIRKSFNKNGALMLMR
jgi:hypothetical protein